MELFRYDKPIDFMGRAKYFGIFSLILVISSWAIILIKGFNYGIDFAGGTVVQIKYDKKAPLDEIREKLSKDNRYKDVTVTYFGSENEVVIRTKGSLEDAKRDIGAEVKELLSDTGNLEIRRVDMVGPKIGDELREKGLKATLFAILGILIYLTIRFEWRFALGFCCSVSSRCLYCTWSNCSLWYLL